ncbi:hypothetical protein ACHAAC_03315 [Aeromicrobium sp. CF4.19]|uniref:hypothetical protein n=1 Tax=Aeromicrobium sp. CF4.19 TaxID=3373082 RepID=UPI003EE5883A
MEKRRSWGARANKSVGSMTGRVDGQTSQAAQHATMVIVPAVRLLRLPTLALLVVPLPFILTTLALGLATDGPARIVLVVIALLMGLVSLAFGARRQRILRAVEEPEVLATELGIAVSLSDRVDETRGVLTAIGGGGGARVFSRLRGLWSGVTMTGRWIDGVDDLERARYFLPPKIGTTVTVAVAALWLVPVSLVVALLSVITVLARAL